VAELAVEAALTGSRELVLQAMLVDPNAASTLTPDRLATLVDELFKAHQDLLPSTLGGGVELDLSDVPNRN
jgi:alpha-galactosidase